jgi:hypothetical protein
MLKGGVFGISFGTEYINTVSSNLTTVLELRPCNVYVAFNIVFVEFNKMETIRFIIECQLIPL